MAESGEVSASRVPVDSYQKALTSAAEIKSGIIRMKGEGHGATLVQGKRKESKPKEKPVESPKPAPIPEPVTPEPDEPEIVLPPPAPIPEPVKPELEKVVPPNPAPNPEPKPEEKPIPKKITISEVAVKHIDQAGKMSEVMEHQAQLGAHELEEEQKKDWEKKRTFFTRFIPRLWHYTINHIGTLSKYKDHYARAWAKAGFSTTTIPYEFLKEVDLVANDDLNEGTRHGLKRFFGGVRDAINRVWSGLTFTDTVYEQERLYLLEAMSKVAENPDSDFAKQFLTQENHRLLFDKYVGVASGDYQAGEAVAQRLSQDIGGELLHTGEVRGREVMHLDENAQGPFKELREFYLKEIITPLLEKGMRGDGKIDQKTMLQLYKKMQALPFSKTFMDAYMDPNFSDESRRALQESLSYGNDLIKVVQEVLIPELKTAKVHMESAADIENYLKDFVIDVNTGTLRDGPRTEIGETFLEKAAARHITNERVHELYQKIRNDGNAPNLVSADEIRSADTRADFAGQYFARHAGLGLYTAAVGGGAYLASRVLGKAGGLVSGGLIAGAIRGYGEWRMTGKEIQLHRLENALGYTFDDAAKRRQELNNTLLPSKEMTPEITNPMKELTQKVKEGKATDKEIQELLGRIADVSARYEIMDTKNIDLFKAQNPQAYQQEQIQMDMAKAQAKVVLRELQNKSDDLKRIASAIGVNIPQNISSDKMLDYVLDRLNDMFVNNLQTGMGLNTNLQTALGAYESADQRSSIDARNRAARFLQGKRAAGAFIGTAGGIIGGYLVSHQLLEWGVDAASHLPGVGAVLERVGMVHHDVFTAAGPPVDVGHGVDIKLPPGVTFQDHVGFVRADGTVLVNMPDSHLEMNHGVLEEVKNDGTHIVNVGDKFKALGFNLQQDGTVNETVVSHGPALLDKIVDTHKTRIPAGTEWIQHGGQAGHWDLVATSDHSKLVLGDATFKPDGTMEVQGVHNLANFNSVDDPTSIARGGGTVVDTHWIDNLKDLKDHNYGGFNFRAINVTNPADIQIQVSDATGKVTDSILHLNSATHTVSIEAPYGNPITPAFANAMKQAGFIKDPKEIYDHVFLDGNLSAPGHVGRVPSAVLNQIYSAPGVKTADFTGAESGGNVKWLSWGGWGKPLGEIAQLNKSEAVYLNYPDWKPMPMLEMIDGHQQFSINHFINNWEGAKLIDATHAQIIGGTHNGEVVDLNPQPGFMPKESADWVNKNIGNTVLLDRVNRSVNQAPEGFLQWLKDMKEGHGDASQVFAETRLDPTSTKGVVMQFSGTAQWNSFADPSKIPGDFSKYAFLPDGSVRGWTHFVWVPKGGDVTREAFSFANLAPTEKAIFQVDDPSTIGEKLFNKMTKIDLTEDITRSKPIYSLSGDRWTTTVPDWMGIPIVFPRRPPEAPSGVRNFQTPIYTIPTVVPITQTTKTTTPPPGGSREELTRKREELSDRIGQLAAEVEGIPKDNLTPEQKQKREEMERLLDEREQVETDLAKLSKEKETVEQLTDKRNKLLEKLGQLNTKMPKDTKTEDLTLDQIKTQKEIEAVMKDLEEVMVQIEEAVLNEPGEPDPETGIKDAVLKTYYEDFVEDISETAKEDSVEELANRFRISQEQAANLKNIALQNKIDATTPLIREIYARMVVEREIMMGQKVNQEVLEKAISRLDSKDQSLTRKGLDIMEGIETSRELNDIFEKVKNELKNKKQPFDNVSISNDPRVREVELKITKQLLKKSNISETEYNRFIEIYNGKLDEYTQDEWDKAKKIKIVALQKQLDRVVPVGEVQESIKIPEAKTLDEAVDFAADLVREGKYLEAMEYLKDEKLANKFGLKFITGARVRISRDLPSNIAELNSEVNSFASQCWYHPNTKSIELSDILVYTPAGKGQPFKSLDKKDYPKELLKEMALGYLEEWVHALQDKKGTQLVEPGNDEIDVAAYMYQKGITPTNAFLLRYDRGYVLKKLGEMDDSLTGRPAFRGGVFVRVKGHENEHWQIAGYNPQKKTFTIRDTQNRYQPFELNEYQLYQENDNQRGVYPFQNIHDFASLYREIQKLENIYGTEQKFTAQELIEVIKNVENKKLDINKAGLPRSGGLRQKVAELAGELTVNPGMTMMIK